MSDHVPLREIRQAIVDKCIHTKENAGRAPISPRGIPQNWLIDLRRVFLERETLERIADAFWTRFESRDSLQVGGMETAAIPLVTAIMLRAPKKMGSVNGFIVRKERKAYGLGNAVEGTVTGAPIVLVDDILNSGGSIEKACKAVEQAGHTVTEAFVVIDYESPGDVTGGSNGASPFTHYFHLKSSVCPFVNGRICLRRNTGSCGKRSFQMAILGMSCRNRPLSSLTAGSTGAAITASCIASTPVPVTSSGLSRRKVPGHRREFWSRPCLHEGRIYFGAYNGVVYCLDEKSGKEIWAQSYAEWIGASPIAVAKHGLLYIGLEYERPWGKGSLAALDLKTGLKVWEVPLRKFQHGSPSYWETGDLIIWGSADHEMCAFKPATGETVWSLKTRRSVKYARRSTSKKGLLLLRRSIHRSTPSMRQRERSLENGKRERFVIQRR